MTKPRLLMQALLQPEVRGALLEKLIRSGLQARLGCHMFPAQNWHQTLSDRYVDSPGNRERLLCAGGRISAQAFTLTLSRLRGPASDGGGPIHWVAGIVGKSQGLDALLAEVRKSLTEEGLDVGGGHTPHITLSYHAPDRLETMAISPIDWTISEILLVVGGASEPYHYDVLGRWPLLPAVSDQQFKLF